MNRLRHLWVLAVIWIAAAGVAMAELEPVEDSATVPNLTVPNLSSSSDGVVPWYRSFTLRSAEIEEGTFLQLKKPDLEFRAGNQWGFSVGMDEPDRVLDSQDRMSAGAFYEFSPRFRLGGELSFVAPGELRISAPNDSVIPVSPLDEEPRVRIESSIKF